jgi:hypothetical protein
MKRPRIASLLLTVAMCAWLVTPRCVFAGEEKATGPMRFVDDEAGGGKLQTAVITFVNPAGAKVHLVGAVHVADAAYYKGLNDSFRKHDVLLYEMVKPKGVDVPRVQDRAPSAVGLIQSALSSVLELQYQLDGIDYTARNFVNADLTMEEFERLQAERGESIFILILRQILADMGKPQDLQVSDVTVAELLVSLTSPDRARHLKLLLARQFDRIEDQLSGLEGGNGTVIVTERNKKAVETLKKALADGKRDIGIFYGAAHIPGMSRMIEQMGFTQSDTQWLTAWDLTAKEGDIAVRKVK